MMKRLSLALAFLLALAGSSHAQGGMGPGPGMVHSTGSSYSGPGDVVSGATAWGSCARAYNAAYANGTNPLCDLVDTSAGGTAICTLRVLTTGFVDLAGSYCTGSTTPAAACAAAAGGACRVSKIYDQTGTTTGWVNATNSQRPVLTFSALNSLPGWTCTAAANSFLATNAAITIATPPITYVAVAKRTANFTTLQAMLGWGTAPNSSLSFNTSANTAAISQNGAGFATLGSLTDSSFHAVQGFVDATGLAGVLSADGTDGSSASVGTDAVSSRALRVCRFAGGSSLDGVMMEAGIWAVALDGTQRGNLNSNMHGTNGYNF
jgi:hypothetical protein